MERWESGENSWQATPALTPALSPEERENHSPQSAANEHSPDLGSPRANIGKLGGAREPLIASRTVHARLPLAGGEGWGEGGRQTTPVFANYLLTENVKEPIISK